MKWNEVDRTPLCVALPYPNSVVVSPMSDYMQSSCVCRPVRAGDRARAPGHGVSKVPGNVIVRADSL